jgi:hypothetical protein
MEAALNDLGCDRGPRVAELKDYGIDLTAFQGNHVQSMVYTGPFSDGTARIFYTRSDTSGSENQLFWNRVDASVIDASGGLIASDANHAPRENARTLDSTHLGQVEWLPDWGASSSGPYESGYLFVADNDAQELRIYHYDGTTDLLEEATTTETRLTRADGGAVGLVWIMKQYDTYWLALGQAKKFDIWTAHATDLFPNGAGSLDPRAFSFLGHYTTSNGGGTTCNFVTDVLGDTYRVCYANDDDLNCNENADNDNSVYATKVTVTASSFAIDDAYTYAVSLGAWGSDAPLSTCQSGCQGTAYPTFRACGDLYVDVAGRLAVYSMAFGGEDTSSCFDGTGTSDGRTEVCTESTPLG